MHLGILDSVNVQSSDPISLIRYGWDGKCSFETEKTELARDKGQKDSQRRLEQVACSERTSQQSRGRRKCHVGERCVAQALKLPNGGLGEVCSKANFVALRANRLVFVFRDPNGISASLYRRISLNKVLLHHTAANSPVKRHSNSRNSIFFPKKENLADSKLVISLVNLSPRFSSFAI